MVACRDDKQYSYTNVHKWTKEKRLARWGQASKCLLDVDKLIFPVHLEAHWTLAVVELKNRCIKYYDSLWVRVSVIAHSNHPIMPLRLYMQVCCYVHMP